VLPRDSRTQEVRGCIVNLSSDAGLMGLKEAAIYCASKGGVVLLTKALALELAPDLVRVNAVCPTEIMTSMLEYNDKQGTVENFLDVADHCDCSYRVTTEGGIRAARAGDVPGDLLNYSFAVWAGSGVYKMIKIG